MTPAPLRRRDDLLDAARRALREDERDARLLAESFRPEEVFAPWTEPRVPAPDELLDEIDALTQPTPPPRPAPSIGVERRAPNLRTSSPPADTPLPELPPTHPDDVFGTRETLAQPDGSAPFPTEGVVSTESGFARDAWVSPPAAAGSDTVEIDFGAQDLAADTRADTQTKGIEDPDLARAQDTGPVADAALPLPRTVAAAIADERDTDRAEAPGPSPSGIDSVPGTATDIATDAMAAGARDVDSEPAADDPWQPESQPVPVALRDTPEARPDETGNLLDDDTDHALAAAPLRDEPLEQVDAPPARFDEQALPAEPDTFEPERAAATADTARGTAVAGDSASSFDSIGEEGPEEDAIDYFAPAEQARGFDSRGAVLGWLGVGVCAVVLVLQLLVAARDRLSAWVPAARPVIAALASPLGLTVEPPRELDALTIESFELQAAGDASTLTLSAILRNRAAHPVRWPAMELTLTDARGGLLVRKVILPGDYLAGSDTSGTDGLNTRAELPIRLALEARDVSPSGYTVLLFYP